PAQPGEGPIGDLGLALGDVLAPRLSADRTFGLPHDVELTITLDLADVDRLVQVVILAIHRQLEAARGLDDLAADRLPYCVDIRGAGLERRLRPHLDPDVGRLHRI